MPEAPATGRSAYLADEGSGSSACEEDSSTGSFRLGSLGVSGHLGLPVWPLPARPHQLARQLLLARSDYWYGSDAQSPAG